VVVKALGDKVKVLEACRAVGSNSKPRWALEVEVEVEVEALEVSTKEETLEKEEVEAGGVGEGFELKSWLQSI